MTLSPIVQASSTVECRACHRANPDSNRFCEGCGSRLPASCPACGRPNSPGAAFCGGCGARLDGPAPEPRAPAPGAAWGEIKQATIMFADVVSSTELVARLTPEQAMEHLRPAMDMMCDEVARVGGTLVNTLGDGVMALFGAPRAQEGHALLACEAAIAIHERFAGIDGAMKVRIGLHSGEVAADPPMPDSGKQRGAHGVAIHIANRVAALAAPAQTCLTRDCYRLVHPFCDVRSLGHHDLRGIPERLETYLLLRMKPAVARQQFRGSTLSPFQGRAFEMGFLQRTLQDVDAGTPRVVGIVAAPGTGKSRLCHEFTAWCRQRSVPVVETAAEPYGHAIPLQPVARLLRSLLGLYHNESPASARGHIEAALSALDVTVDADLPMMCEFLGVPFGPGQTAQLAPSTRHVRLFDIARRLVIRSGERTSVVLIEDLHWLDDVSQEFMATLVDAVAGTRTLLVLTYRSAYAATWMQRPWFRQLPLSDLDPAECGAFLDGLLGTARDLHDVRVRIAERSAGNPFFAEELTRSLVERGILVGMPGHYAVVRDAEIDVLPSTVHAVIEARIDHLEGRERRLLHVAAIVGRSIPGAVLALVTADSAEDIADGLARLCDAELLVRQPGLGEAQYDFRHPLTQEVAYGAQLSRRRGELHAAVAAAMEQFYRDRIDEFSGLLAHHYELAGQPRAAARYGAQAAHWIGATSSALAIKQWHRVRLLLQGEPRDAETDPLRVMASGQIAWLGWREGMTADVGQPFIGEALSLAREIDDRLVPLLLFAEARISGATGGPADAYVERIKGALALLKPDEDAARASTLYASLSQAYGWAGLLREALAANDAALQRLPGTADTFDDRFLGYRAEHWIKSLRGRFLVRLGRLDEAQPWIDAIQQIDTRLVDPTVQFIAHFTSLEIACHVQDREMAELYSRRVSEMATRHGSPYLRVFALAGCGMARGVAGDHHAAATKFTEAITLVRDQKAAIDFEAELLAGLADAFLRLGDQGKAMTVATECIALARARNSRLPECRATITYGAALAVGRRPQDRAEAAHWFDRVEEMIALTGCALYRPLLTEARAVASAMASGPAA